MGGLSCFHVMLGVHIDSTRHQRSTTACLLMLLLLGVLVPAGWQEDIHAADGQAQPSQAGQLP
jgi:hypothetical protein